MAEQLALLVQDLLSRVQTHELVELAWQKQKESTPNVTNYTSHCNRLSMLVTSTVVQMLSLQGRAEMIRKWIKVARQSMRIQDYATVMSIMAGLGNTAAHRLAKTWASLKSHKQAAYQDLVDFTEPQAFRKAMYSLGSFSAPPRGIKKSTPVVPFLGVYQTDLTFMEEGMVGPDYIEQESATGEQVPMTGRDTDHRFDRCTDHRFDCRTDCQSKLRTDCQAKLRTDCRTDRCTE